MHRSCISQLNIDIGGIGGFQQDHSVKLRKQRQIWILYQEFCHWVSELEVNRAMRLSALSIFFAYLFGIFDEKSAFLFLLACVKLCLLHWWCCHGNTTYLTSNHEMLSKLAFSSFFVMTRCLRHRRGQRCSGSNHQGRNNRFFVTKRP